MRYLSASPCALLDCTVHASAAARMHVQYNQALTDAQSAQDQTEGGGTDYGGGMSVDVPAGQAAGRGVLPRLRQAGGRLG